MSRFFKSAAFPILIAVTLLVIVLQVRSIPAMFMVFLTSPLGLIGVELA